MKLGIEVTELLDLAEAWDKAPEAVAEELIAATEEAEALLLRELKDLESYTPTGATGTLRGSIHAVPPQVTPLGVLGLVGTSIAHAVPVELGTRPHFPPLSPLVDWVRAKLNITDEARAVSVAMSIQRKIGAKGTKGQMMFHRVFEDYAQQVGAIYEKAHHRIAEHLGGS